MADIWELIKNNIHEKNNSLNLENKSIQKLPEEICNLTHLVHLNLNGNRIKDLPNELANLIYLETLDLRNNELRKLPEVIFELPNLRNLWLSNNIISDVPKGLSKLNTLKNLNLSFNRIKLIEEGIFSNLRLLKAIRLNNNPLQKLPDDISNLIFLRDLDISKTKIEILPKSMEYLINLVNIKTIELQISNVPLEIVVRGAKTIVNYFQSLIDEVEIFEAKLIIVGEGNVGKSSLSSRIVSNEYNDSEKSTEGIEINYFFIETKKTDKFRINLWDFGGQEIYHSTHQFFLTKRSLYLYVWTARDDDRKFEYWLNIVNLLSDRAPVICILNKIDERIKEIDEIGLKSKFPNIVSFNKVSAKDSRGINELKIEISSNLDKLPHIGDKLPKVWLDIRFYLEELKKDYIDYNEYLEICKKKDLNEEKANFLSQYFHDLGVFLHFQKDEFLKDIIFLKPEWATNAVYKILDTKSVQNDFGKFKYSDLSHILTEYPKEKYLHLIELMKKFELCFEFNNSKNYLVPELLNPRRPDFNWNYAKNLSFEYNYDFMPDGIINRLIVKLKEYVKGELFWKFGAIFKFKDVEGLVTSETYEKKIKIFISEKTKHFNNITEDDKEAVKSNEIDEIKSLAKFSLLELIRRNIEIINESLNFPAVKEMLPCCCEECIIGMDKYYFDSSLIHRALEKRKTVLQCQKSFLEIEIKTLMTGFNPFKKNKTEKKFSEISIENSSVIFND